MYNTAHGILFLYDEFSEIIMSGETSDMSLFLFQWYEWVMFCDISIHFPYKNMVWDRYLGPGIGVGPELTDIILKYNRDVFIRPTYPGLSPQ